MEKLTVEQKLNIYKDVLEHLKIYKYTGNKARWEYFMCNAIIISTRNLYKEFTEKNPLFKRDILFVSDELNYYHWGTRDYIIVLRFFRVLFYEFYKRKPKEAFWSDSWFSPVEGNFDFDSRIAVIEDIIKELQNEKEKDEIQIQ